MEFLLCFFFFLIGSQETKKPSIYLSIKLSSVPFLRSHLSSWLPFHCLPGRQLFLAPTLTCSHLLSLGHSRLPCGFHGAFSASLLHTGFPESCSLPPSDPEDTQPAASTATNVRGTSQGEVKTLILELETIFFCVYCLLLLLSAKTILSGFNFVYGVKKRSSLTS